MDNIIGIVVSRMEIDEYLERTNNIMDISVYYDKHIIHLKYEIPLYFNIFYKNDCFWTDLLWNQ